MADGLAPGCSLSANCAPASGRADWKEPNRPAANISNRTDRSPHEPSNARGSHLARYLVAASSRDIPAILVFNKVDLVSEQERPSYDERLNVYRRLDLPVLTVSAKDGTGIDELLNSLSDGMAVFVGHSGVGKTSLINHVCP